jgi:integrase
MIEIDVAPRVKPANPYLVQKTLALNTNRAYRADVAHFAAFCAANGLGGPMPAEPEVIAAYLASIARTHAVTTLSRRVRAIVQAHHAAGLNLGSNQEVIRQTIAEITRQHGTAPRRAAALGTHEMRQLIATCGTDPTGTRDCAMLLIGFAGALRRSEIVGIDFEHLTFQPDSLRLLIPRSKSDQKGAGAEVVIPNGRDRQTCPVQALRRWLTVSATQYGPVFRGIDRWGAISQERFHPDGVRRIVQRAAERAGITVAAHEGLSPHGLRAGCVTEAYRKGARPEDIMAHTRHRSYSTLRIYIRRSNKLSDNPARLLGL